MAHAMAGRRGEDVDDDVRAGCLGTGPPGCDGAGKIVSLARARDVAGAVCRINHEDTTR